MRLVSTASCCISCYLILYGCSVGVDHTVRMHELFEIFSGKIEIRLMRKEVVSAVLCFGRSGLSIVCSSCKSFGGLKRFCLFIWTVLSHALRSLRLQWDLLSVGWEPEKAWHVILFFEPWNARLSKVPSSANTVPYAWPRGRLRVNWYQLSVRDLLHKCSVWKWLPSSYY